MNSCKSFKVITNIDWNIFVAKCKQNIFAPKYFIAELTIFEKFRQISVKDVNSRFMDLLVICSV